MSHYIVKVLGRKVPGDNVEQITLLEQNEAVRLDGACLKQLYEQLGDTDAENIVCRALEELAARMAHIESCYRAEEWRDLHKSVRGLIAISEQIGMEKLVSVAGDVMTCVDKGDLVALSATIARLLRIGETSLYKVWDLQDYSI